MGLRRFYNDRLLQVPNENPDMNPAIPGLVRTCHKHFPAWKCFFPSAVCDMDWLSFRENLGESLHEKKKKMLSDIWKTLGNPMQLTLHS